MKYKLLSLGGEEIHVNPISQQKAQKMLRKGNAKLVEDGVLQVITKAYEQNMQAIARHVKEQADAHKNVPAPRLAQGNGWSFKDGMSNNAVTAYRDGKVPLSRVSRKLLDEYSISLTVKEAKELLLSSGPCEYHHTSKFANRTDFYDLCDLANFVNEKGDKNDNTNCNTKMPSN